MFDWLRRLFGRRKKTTLELLEETFEVPKEKRVSEQLKAGIPPYVIEHRLKAARKRRRSHDIGKHMKKHGRWSKGYRASIRAKKQPEEEDND